MTAKRPLGPVLIGGVAMPYSKGVAAGGFLFLTGLDGRVDDEGTAVSGIAAQTRLALDRGQAILRDAGSDFAQVVRIVQYLAHPGLLDGYHQARESWLAENAPTLLREMSYAGTLVIVGFSRPDRLVELEVTALAGGAA